MIDLEYFNVDERVTPLLSTTEKIEEVEDLLYMSPWEFTPVEEVDEEVEDLLIKEGIEEE